jgi:hypothetical protein
VATVATSWVGDVVPLRPDAASDSLDELPDTPPDLSSFVPDVSVLLLALEFNTYCLAPTANLASAFPREDGGLVLPSKLSETLVSPPAAVIAPPRTTPAALDMPRNFGTVAGREREVECAA